MRKMGICKFLKSRSAPYCADADEFTVEKNWSKNGVKEHKDGKKEKKL